MHLKALELENFKTFAKHTTIPFFKGFTGITGPNGSGKSNIPDAILFVLGPRSPKLIRAGRLTDLIFNGGKSKRPAEYCKVSLIFDNTDRIMPLDSNEVKLTRLVKLAGENNPEGYYSYFYVNGKSSSLTEFENLLRYAHISADGYNIVLQGDVSRIVQMTLVERRKILDDAAGVTSFDDDLAKAEKERLEVDGNIERINIIMSEIENNIQYLKKDREVALKYKETSDRLILAKASLAAKMKEDLESQISSIRDQISKYSKEKDSLNKQVEELRIRHAEATEKLYEIEGRIAKMRGDSDTGLLSKIEECKTRAVTANERINFYGDEIKRLADEKDSAEKDLAGIERELRKYEKDLASTNEVLDSKIKELEMRSKELKEAKDLAGATSDGAMAIQRELINLRQEYENQTQKMHNLKLDKDRVSEQYNRVRVRLAELEEEIKTYEFELKDLDWQAKEVRNEIKNLQEIKDKAEKEIFDKRKKLSELTKQQNDLGVLVRKLTAEYERAKAEGEAKEDVRRGINRTVDAIIDARNTGKIKGICGTISELGNAEEKYATAISASAGNRINSIIVESDAVAAECIEYLKRNRLGRATFLPLNKMVSGRPRGAAIIARQDPKAIGFAIDLIKFDERYRAAFWYVFGDTVVVDNLDTARRLMGGARLVSLDGSLIEAGGAMIGGYMEKGAFGQSFGPGHQVDIEGISAKLREANQEYENVSQEILSLQNDIRELTDAIAQANPNLDRNSIKLADMELRRKSAQSKLDGTRNEYEGTKKQFEDLSRNLAVIEQGLEKISAEIQRLEGLREEKGKLLLKASGKELSQKIRILESVVSELEKEVNQLKSKIEVLSTNIQLTMQRREEVVKRVAGAASQISHYKSDIENYKRVLAESQSQLDVLMKAQSQLSEQERRLGEERDKKYNECADLNARIDKISTRIETYSGLISDANYKLSGLESQLEEKMQELSLYGSIKLPEKLPTMDELKTTIALCDQTINSIGSVNLRAIEDYDYQCRRRDELKEQIKRLEEQKSHLMSLMEEIKTKKKAVFMKVFDEVSANFKEIYAKLAGGEGELLLENPDDPFAGGLILRAKPKDRRWTRLEALSGGERSITSMAFIFALQQYQPSPFYIFDEMDQNMDAVNAEMTARMIRERSASAQFIAISLKKIVLKAADHVYGVTSNDGISTIVGELDIDSIVEPKAERLENGQLPRGQGS